jgi:hypothetical protein
MGGMTRLSAALALVLALASCGDDAAPQPPPDRSAKHAFIAKADRICADYERAVRDQPAAGSLREVAHSIAATRAPAERFLADLRRLDPPPQDAAVFEEFVALLNRTVQSLPVIEQAAADRKRGAVRRMLGVIADRAERQRELARAYGFRVCGTP